MSAYDLNETQSSKSSTYVVTGPPARACFGPNGRYYYLSNNGTSSYFRYSDLGYPTEAKGSLLGGLSLGNGTSANTLAIVGSVAYVGYANTIRKISISSDSIMSTINSSTFISGLALDAVGTMYVLKYDGSIEKYLPISAPSSVSGSVLENSVSVTWSNTTTNDGDFSGVTIRRSHEAYPTSAVTGIGITVTSNNVLTNQALLDSGLEYNTVYYYTIFNRTLDGFYGPGVTFSVTTSPGPTYFTSSTKNAPNGNSITLHWDTAPAGTSKFLLTRSRNGDPPVTVTANIDPVLTTYTDTGLEDGTYMYNIYAINIQDSASPVATSAAVEIDTTAPASPGITATKPTLNGKQIDLEWDTPADTHTFLLQRIKDGEIPVTVSANIPSINRTFSDRNISEDGSYQYLLFAFDSFGNISNAGLSTPQIIDTTPPEAPIIRATKPVGNGTSISLEWTKPAGVDKFLIQRSKNGGAPLTVNANIASSNISYLDTGLTDDGTYVYSIFADDSLGNRSQGTTSNSVVIDTKGPEAPVFTSVSKSSLNGNTVHLSWRSPSDTYTFSLFRSKDGGIPTAVSINIPAATLSYSDSTITQDGRYTYFIYAFDSNTNTSNVETSDPVVVDQTPPNAPSFTSASKPNLNSNVVNLAWLSPADTATFVLYRTKDSATPTLVTTSVAVSLNAVGDTVPQDGTFTYLLYAIDAFGNTSNVGTSSSIIIDTTSPDAPSHFSATALGSNLTLSWTNPATDFNSVTIRKSTLTFPSSIDSGDPLLSNSTATQISQTDLADGQYFYSIFAQDDFGNISAAATASVVVSNASFEKTGTTSDHQTTANISTNLKLTDIPILIGNKTLVTVTIENAKLENKGGIVGNNIDERGKVEIVKANSTWINSADLVVGNKGTGQVVQTSGTVEVNGVLTIGKESTSSGSYQLTGGTLKATSIAVGSGNATFDWQGGEIQAKTILVSLTNNGSGKLATPASANSITIVGDFTGSRNGAVDLTIFPTNLTQRNTISIAASSVADDGSQLPNAGVFALNVDNNCRVDGALSVSLPNGFVPKIGDTFRIIKAKQITGTFTSMTLPTLPEGQSWDTAKIYTNGTIQVQAASGSLLVGKLLNYPNPFKKSAATTIGYRLSQDANIELRIYTLTGHLLVTKSFAAGSPGGQSGYNTIEISSNDFPSGGAADVYVYVLLNNDKVLGRSKMGILP